MRLRAHRKWTRWQSIDKRADWRGCAVYEIRMVQKSRPVCVKRFLKPDSEGIVLIGLSTDMERRRKQFNLALDKGREHSEGNLLYLLQKHTKIRAVFDGLPYRFATCAPNQIEKREAAPIKSYVRKFCETPLLNSAIPQRYDRSGWYS